MCPGDVIYGFVIEPPLAAGAIYIDGWEALARAAQHYSH